MVNESLENIQNELLFLERAVPKQSQIKYPIDLSEPEQTVLEKQTKRDIEHEWQNIETTLAAVKLLINGFTQNHPSENQKPENKEKANSVSLIAYLKLGRK